MDMDLNRYVCIHSHVLSLGNFFCPYIFNIINIYSTLCVSSLWFLSLSLLCCEKSLKISKGQSEYEYRRRTDNTMAKRPRVCRSLLIYDISRLGICRLSAKKWQRYRFKFMVSNTIFNDISAISWRSVLLVEETGIPGENHQPVTIY